MRISHLFGLTLREAPADVELVSHQLMLRAALIRPLGAGIFSLLPLGWRVIRNIERIIREEMDAMLFGLNPRYTVGKTGNSTRTRDTLIVRVVTGMRAAIGSTLIAAGNRIHTAA